MWFGGRELVGHGACARVRVEVTWTRITCFRVDFVDVLALDLIDYEAHLPLIAA